MRNKNKNNENESAKSGAEVNDAPIENVGAEINEPQGDAEPETERAEPKKSKSVTSTETSSGSEMVESTPIDEARYNQLNRVAVGYGMKKHELIDFFKREISSEVEAISHPQNGRQVQFKYKEHIFPKEGYYSSK